MIVQVHGGPSSAVVSSWPSLNTALVASGYAVFLPNPRGSYGQGEAFTQANVKDFGYGDLRDIVRGTDAALATGTSIKAAHITELRTAIDQARSTIGLPALVYVDPAIAVDVTPVKTSHITNLRDGAK